MISVVHPMSYRLRSIGPYWFLAYGLSTCTLFLGLIFTTVTILPIHFLHVFLTDCSLLVPNIYTSKHRYVCKRSTGCVMWPNYDVVGFQLLLGVNAALDSVAYCYVPITCIPWYSNPWLIHCMGSSAHLGVACLSPIIT